LSFSFYGSPGERADIIADFRGLNVKGKKLNWVNIASAPYDGTDVDLPIGTNPRNIVGVLDLNTNHNDPISGIPTLAEFNLRQKNACVIQFRVQNINWATNNFNMPSILSNSFIRMSHSTLPAIHNHRFIALVEEAKEFKDSNGNPIPDPLDTSKNLTEPMLMLRELEELAVGEVIPVGEFSATIDGTTYKSIASMFYDPVNFIIRFGSLEVWKVVNLTGDTHPFHVHLVQFQALGRQKFNEDIPNGVEGTPNSVGSTVFNLTLAQPTPDDSLLDNNEKGWKDTIRVNPNEILTIAMTFDGYNGKYMYHCHLLEHEDKEMMRPFSVLPDAIVDKMNMGGHHH
jgi:FtsP/CotA-like multicopper oxidase with cupredoxin domain